MGLPFSFIRRGVVIVASIEVKYIVVAVVDVCLVVIAACVELATGTLKRCGRSRRGGVNKIRVMFAAILVA